MTHDELARLSAPFPHGSDRPGQPRAEQERRGGLEDGLLNRRRRARDGSD